MVDAHFQDREWGISTQQYEMQPQGQVEVVSGTKTAAFIGLLPEWFIRKLSPPTVTGYGSQGTV